MKTYKVTMLITVHSTPIGKYVEVVNAEDPEKAEYLAINRLPFPAGALQQDSLTIVTEEIEEEKTMNHYLVTLQVKINHNETRIFNYHVLSPNEQGARRDAIQMLDSKLRPLLNYTDVTVEYRARPKAIPPLPEAYDALNLPHITEFERRILLERYYAAIAICDIILHKWETTFPDEEYFPTAAKKTRGHIKYLMGASKEAKERQLFGRLRYYVDTLWEYIDG